MVNQSDVTIDSLPALEVPEWWSTVKTVMRPIPTAVWASIVYQESKGKAGARNLTTQEDSVGLFQLNRLGGQGQDFTVEQLENPFFNASKAKPAILYAYQAIGMPTILSEEQMAQVCIQSGHPGPVATTDGRIQAQVRNYKAALSAPDGDAVWQAIVTANTDGKASVSPAVAKAGATGAGVATGAAVGGPGGAAVAGVAGGLSDAFEGAIKKVMDSIIQKIRDNKVFLAVIAIGLILVLAGALGAART